MREMNKTVYDLRIAELSGKLGERYGRILKGLEQKLSEIRTRDDKKDRI